MGRLMAWFARVLNVVPPEELAGIRMGDCWELSGRVAPSAFLRSLPILVPDDAFVVLEGGLPSDAMRSFVATVALGPGPVARGTVWPRQSVVSLPASPTVLNQLAGLAEESASAELCIHLHVYRADSVLLQWYDAFHAPLYVSTALPVETIDAFCARLKVSRAECSIAV
jgi:hypothetical protein